MSAPSPHHQILSLTLRASPFFGDITIPFTDGLNDLMGGRGSGKTSVLYLVRFALGHAIPKHYAAEFDEQIRYVLGPGEAILHVRTQHGVEYWGTRSYGKPPKVTDATGKEVDISLDGDLFRIDAYAAKEIERMASDPVEQLKLLDRFASTEMRRFAHALEDVERRIAQVAAEVDGIDAEIEAHAAREAERPAVADALNALAPVDPTPDDARARAEARRPKRGREQNAMNGVSAQIANVQRGLELFAREAQRLLVSSIDGELEREPDPLGPLFRRTHEAVHRAASALEGTAGRLRADLTQAEQAVLVEARALTAFHGKEEETYKTLVVHKDTDPKRALERERLHRLRDDLDALAKGVAQQRRDSERKHAEHAALMREREAILLARYELRAKIAREITSAVKEQIEVTVTRGGLLAPYVDLLVDVLAKSGLQAEYIKRIAESIPPEELYALVVRDDAAPIMAVDEMKTGKPARAQKLFSWLRASGRLREIETAPLDDRTFIGLRVGKECLPSGQLSTGQKCTAILPFLLLPSVSPLLVDQIEDHLDNEFIFRVLVATLVAAKGGRQFLFASHNANIPVLSDAEQVLEMAVKDAKGYLAASGDVDKMRERIEALLEGGREAFVRRGERYGHLPKRPAPK
jgi:hypothetical protein